MFVSWSCTTRQTFSGSTLPRIRARSVHDVPPLVDVSHATYSPASSESSISQEKVMVAFCRPWSAMEIEMSWESAQEPSTSAEQFPLVARCVERV